jgi:hypothetical protein
MVGASIGRSLARHSVYPRSAFTTWKPTCWLRCWPIRNRGAIRALLVSGGHTQLVRVDAIGNYQILGESIDDAVGEAFDKTAKMLGLGYPGGPAVARIAERGNPRRFTFPRPMTDRPGLDFSFSGLKTFTLNTCSDLAKPTTRMPTSARVRRRGRRHVDDQCNSRSNDRAQSIDHRRRRRGNRARAAHDQRAAACTTPAALAPTTAPWWRSPVISDSPRVNTPR